MSPDDQTQGPAAGAASARPADPSPQPAASPTPLSSMWRWEDVFADSDLPKGEDESDAVSNGAADRPAAETPAAATDAKPAPESPEGVSAPDSAPEPDPASDPSTDKPLSRRQQEAAEKQAEIDRLKGELAERDKPETIAALREQWQRDYEAEQTRKAAAAVDEDFLGNQDRFETLKARSYLDLTADEREWLDVREQRRAEYAPVERHYREIYDRKAEQAGRIADERANTTVRDGWARIRQDMVDGIAASEQLPEVDASAFRREGITWKEMAEQIHAAGAAWKERQLNDRVTAAEEEASTLRKQLEEIRNEDARSARLPAVVGRSSASANGRSDAMDPSRSWRNDFADIFGTNGTG